ncbi:hypothetical protein INT45_003274 [Circinella minor]|uniref:EF-hand domain-containing protein n=1 Tax=Circinella minor TaxID=1195481 RepID=A0A8H7S7I0_9FUNG|nr:hypothetical protein INT45_003274 [Circinella minor]
MITREQRKEIKEVFKATDTVGAGLLDGEGLYKGLRTLGLEVPISEGGIESLLRSVNRHEEGYIDSDDFNTIVSNLMTMQQQQQNDQNNNEDEDDYYKYDDMDDEEEEEEEFIDDNQRDDAFQALTQNSKNGMITLESLQQTCKEQGEDWTIQEVKEMLNEADINHDGVIDPIEFKRIWKLAGF